MTSAYHRLSFVGASTSLVATYAASATPIPLYGSYRAVDGLTYGDLSLSSVIYFAGAVTALLVFGRLSNHLGRRLPALLALLLAMCACLLLTTVHQATPLLVARGLQGLSCGLASTALAAWLVDRAPRSPAWLAPAIISCGPMTGLTLGGMMAGALVEYAPWPRVLPYLVVLAVLLVCAVVLLCARETLARRPGVIASLRPHFSMPAVARRAFPVAACVFVSTWALGGFYQAFGPAMAREQLHSASALAAALVFASIMAPGALGASLAGRMSARMAQRLGILVFAVGVVAVLLSLKAGLLVPFLIASVVAGTAQGLTLSGSIQTVVGEVAQQERASVLSVIYATSYAGAAIPTLIAGQLSAYFSLVQVASAYALLALCGCLVVLLSALPGHFVVGKDTPEAQ
ncbi:MULTISPECIES: MFS transporter [Pseudomonas]|uniref:MFS transporter n=1 Tax=Pseudomonas TaxID=286 RepID=UPI0038239B6E